jgi:magnesium transporter
MLMSLSKGAIQNERITYRNSSKLSDSIWIDLLYPTKDEEKILETFLGFGIPTLDEMVEIELSSRLYSENGNLFMTSLMISNSNSPDSVLEPVTFILTGTQLITIRYVESQSFKLFLVRLNKVKIVYDDALILLIDLLDVSVDRLADILEYIGHGVDDYSKNIFHPNYVSTKLNYHKLLQQIAVSSDLNTKAQESLVTFNRLIAYLSQAKTTKLDKDRKTKLAALRNDILSLSQHTHFLTSKVSFLLDATLGLVSIEQNNIIKIFSVAAVIFLPPTLIASIYGMNFQFIPELKWKYGYLGAIGLILLAAWAPYKFFKYKKWL